MEFPRHQQYIANLYNFFVHDVCTQGMYEMQKNYTALLNIPIGLLNKELPFNTTTEFQKKRNLMGLSADLPDLAVGYVTGGRVSNLSNKTLTGYTGLYTEHPAILDLPSSMEYLDKKATKDGKSLENLSIDILGEVLKNGNCHVLADIDPADNKIRFVSYDNKTRVNWDQIGSDEDDYRYRQIIFKEVNNVGDLVEGQQTEISYIKYSLDDGIYTITKYDESRNIIKDSYQPQFLGRTLDFIPVVSIGSVDNSPDIDPAPLEPIMQIMVAILGMDTELSYFNMMATAPTLVITGIDEDSLPKVIGPGVAIALPQYTSKAYYTEVDSSALEHIRHKINDAYAEAQEYGASLLGSSKNMSESGEALRLRQQATTVNLRSVVNNVGKGILKLLTMTARWMKENPEDCVYQPNKEFSTFSLTAQEQQALVQSWQANGISHSTLLYNFRKAGLLQPGETVEDEMKRTEDPNEQFDSDSDESIIQGDKATAVAGDTN